MAYFVVISTDDRNQPGTIRVDYEVEVVPAASAAVGGPGERGGTRQGRINIWVDQPAPGAGPHLYLSLRLEEAAELKRELTRVLELLKERERVAG